MSKFTIYVGTSRGKYKLIKSKLNYSLKNFLSKSFKNSEFAKFF